MTHQGQKPKRGKVPGGGRGGGGAGPFLGPLHSFFGAGGRAGAASGGIGGGFRTSSWGRRMGVRGTSSIRVLANCPAGMTAGGPGTGAGGASGELSDLCKPPEAKESRAWASSKGVW